MTRVALPHMGRTTCGCVVLITSFAGWKADSSVYSASMFALQGSAEFPSHVERSRRAGSRILNLMPRHRIMQVLISEPSAAPINPFLTVLLTLA